MAGTRIGSWMYHQTQINGERITTNLAFKCCLMAERNPTEVFVSRIPYTMYEDKLIPMFETIGVVMQFRLMMKLSGRNRGFGYIIFFDQNDGHRAIAILNNVWVSSWARLRLCISRNTRRLWLTNVNGEMIVNDIINLIVEKVDPEQISICRRRGQPCFILSFKTHRDAAISRKMLKRDMLDFGLSARTNWDFDSTP